MHLPCRVTVTEDCGLVAGEGGFFVARFAYRLGSKHWCLELAVGTEEGGLLARAGAIAFNQVASWEVQEEGEGLKPLDRRSTSGRASPAACWRPESTSGA